ncbi:ribonuclease HI [Rothia aeria]|uniref:Ribonuclease HI n=1 Tax=Rothia aeria TaxID=172042 RepID=A0A2Z5QVM0_9MICC|nr:ribonuclease HI [Rothia aeria]
MSEIIAAADGSALGNPGPAGWAWYIDDNHWAAGAGSTAPTIWVS